MQHPNETKTGKAQHILLIFRQKIATSYKWRSQIIPVLYYRIRQHINYQLWIARNRPSQKELAQQSIVSKDFQYQPLLSIIMPVYNVDLIWLRTAIDSVRAQTYENFELCIADDASTNTNIKSYLKEIASKDARIRITFREKNGHISHASNSAIRLASGEFICMLDHDDILYPHALFTLVKRLNANPALDLIYTDSDLLIHNKRRYPFFKPDWSPDFFYSNNYLNHLTLLRKTLVDKVGGFRAGFEGSQDYDLYLRVAGKTESKRIAHIPDVLYGWRSIPGSAASDLSNKEYAISAGQRALYESLNGQKINVDIQPGITKNTFQVRYFLENNPLLSIIIAGKRQGFDLQPCLNSLKEKGNYNNVEILYIRDYINEVPSLYNVKQILPLVPGQAKTQMRNLGVQQAQGKFILFIDENINLTTEQSLLFLLEHAQRKEIGLVGPKVILPNTQIYSAGIVMGRVSSLYAHVFKSKADRKEDYRTNTVKNYLALSDLCFMIAKDKFDQVNGYSQEFNSDLLSHLDFCLRLYQAGYCHLYTPFVTVCNLALSDRKIDPGEAVAFRNKWRNYVEDDPYYSPNFSKRRTDFSI
jgi:glycosyltransferase involved in cell wall biosynthesis